MTIASRATDLQEAVRVMDPTIKDEALAVLRNLVKKVVLSPLPDGFQVELVGAIANMLSLPDQGPELDGYKSSV